MTLTGRLGGDYPAFYGAGRIVAQGYVEGLYSPELQKRVQKDLFPAKSGNEYLAFAYPPQAALAYVPLSFLDYRLSYSLHCIIMLGSLFLSLHLIRPMVKQVDHYFLIAFTLSLFFFPILRSVMGGQNTVFSLLIIAAAWRAFEEGHEYLSGAVFTILVFKPQLALPFIGMLALAGYWKACIGSACTGILFYSVGVLMQGPGWLSKWLAFATWFSDTDSLVNKTNSVSWLGFLKAFPILKSWSAGIGWMLTTITIVVLSWFLWKRRKSEMRTRIGFTSICLVLISPHLMYYDIGLVLFTLVALLGRLQTRGIAFIALVWLLGFSQIAASMIGFSPLFFMAVFLWISSVYFFILSPSTLSPPSRSDPIHN